MDELKNQFTELSKIKKKLPFKVPENYFDDFSARLNNRLEAERYAVPKPQNRFIQILKPALGLAASFALIFMLVYWPLKNFSPNQEADSSTEYDISDMEYINMMEEIDEYSFYALLEEPSKQVNFTDDDIASYLQTNSSEYEISTETHN